MDCVDAFIKDLKMRAENSRANQQRHEAHKDYGSAIAAKARAEAYEYAIKSAEDLAVALDNELYEKDPARDE